MSQPGGFEIRHVSGADVAPWIADLARLRITVFRDFPYLYEGTVAYEEKYLQTYVRSPDSIVVLALAQGRVVGASTGLPMAHETDEFKQPFAAAGHDPARVFYCGESILLRDYRGRGLYKAFFEGRENHARRLGGMDWCSFCCVQRPENHPLRPQDHVPLDAVWRKFGYRPQPGLRAFYAWQDIDQTSETQHDMLFWMKPLHGEPA